MIFNDVLKLISETVKLNILLYHKNELVYYLNLIFYSYAIEGNPNQIEISKLVNPMD